MASINFLSGSGRAMILQRLTPTPAKIKKFLCLFQPANSMQLLLHFLCSPPLTRHIFSSVQYCWNKMHYKLKLAMSILGIFLGKITRNHEWPQANLSGCGRGYDITKAVSNTSPDGFIYLNKTSFHRHSIKGFQWGQVTSNLEKSK
jgi:hypothetical protein